MSDCIISISSPVGAGFARHLRKYLPAILPLACPALKEISVVLVDDEHISQLHAQFFNDPSTTDVITFPLEENKKGQVISGEIYICLPEVLRQARARKMRRHRDELILYLVHGCLHLGGHVDTNKRGYTKMHAREDEILEQIGIGATFAPERKAVR